MPSNESILKHYSRKDIQKELVKAAKNREAAVKFGDSGYGKRPDILQYDSDVGEFAEQGATSFHISEERWSDPLKLKSGMIRRELDELRTGFDFIVDIDCKFLEYSKICAKIIVDIFNVYEIKNFGIKFSGGSGFHIIIPFEALPEILNNQETRLQFPEVPRLVAEYIKYMIKDRLASSILEISSVDEIAKATGKNISELNVNDKFNPFSVLGIDSQLISSRHMVRAPYSVNEKTGLVSIPIKPSEIMTFNISKAKIENVAVEDEFMKNADNQEAKAFMVQAVDWSFKNVPKKEVQLKDERKRFESSFKPKPEMFPPCIKLILEGVKNDGRKRAVFILMNFLRSNNYTMEEIKNILFEWNKKNYEPLKDGYIISQLSWHSRQGRSLPPPNCDNEMYMKGIGVCQPDFHCSKIKNPANYPGVKARMLKHKKY